MELHASLICALSHPRKHAFPNQGVFTKIKDGLHDPYAALAKASLHDQNSHLINWNDLQ
jgi:hypothetical protein